MAKPEDLYLFRKVKSSYMAKNSDIYNCWLCEGSSLCLVKPSNIAGEVTSENFAITDANYGITADIFKCQDCGFMQCSNFPDVLNFYESLEDPSYEELRVQRGLQQKKMLQRIQQFKKNGRLLDIGASSGILVEQALELGFDAEGVEPSKFLWKIAREFSLPVCLGEFPHPENKPPFDIITLIDIIEHVNNPIQLLENVHKHLTNDGVGAIVTPNVESWMAKIFGYKWWHYRIGHIGYFQQETLLLALDRAGFEQIKIYRPGWYFSADYLLERLNNYIPGSIHIKPPSALRKVTIPLNLLDSLFILFRKK